jgi:hypothetical protein
MGGARQMSACAKQRLDQTGRPLFKRMRSFPIGIARSRHIALKRKNILQRKPHPGKHPRARSFKRDRIAAKGSPLILHVNTPFPAGKIMYGTV